MKTPSLLASLTVLVAAPLSTFAQLYSVDVIGPFNGKYTYATALNSSGVVLGHFGGEIPDIYLSIGGVDTFPGNLGGLFPHESGINDAGDFVGQYLHNGNYHAYVSIGGVITDLGYLGGNQFSGASDINNSGQIVGQTTTPTATTRAFLYANGVMSELGTLGGDVSSAAAINELGGIAGYSTTAAQAYHAFFYAGGLMTDLGTLGGADSFSEDVNALEQVVGFSNFASGDNRTHAFVYSSGSMLDLGTLGGNSSWAKAINDSGWIVGGSNTPTSAHAFISDGVTMTDLNSLVDLTGTGLQYLTSANDINASGQITGDAVNAQGITVAYRLTPLTSAVPEPSTYGLIGALALILVVFGRRLRATRPIRAA